MSGYGVHFKPRVPERFAGLRGNKPDQFIFVFRDQLDEPGKHVSALFVGFGLPPERAFRADWTAFSTSDAVAAHPDQITSPEKGLIEDRNVAPLPATSSPSMMWDGAERKSSKIDIVSPYVCRKRRQAPLRRA